MKKTLSLTAIGVLGGIAAASAQVNSTNIAGTNNVLQASASSSAILAGRTSTNGGTNSAIIGAANSVIPTTTRFAFIGAGAYNTIAAGAHSAGMVAGYSNTLATGSVRGAVVGGAFNTNAGRSAAILAGEFNQIGINATGAAVVGGLSNLVGTNALYGFIGGGSFNEVRAPGATVPGGFANEAAGTNSFAAGSQAVASNTGTFVWADMSTSTDFVSTANNQFIIRARGGVGINTNNPGSNALFVNGRAQVSGDLQVTGQIFGNLSTSNADLNSVSASNSFSIQTAGTTAWFASAQATNLSPYFQTSFNSRNIVAGYSSNSVAAGVIGATIAGGGGIEVGAASTGYNQVKGNFGTVGGGFGNEADGEFSLVSGGDQNKSKETYSVVVGGFANESGGFHSFIGGGDRNIAQGAYSVIGGGQENTINGSHSFIGGGLSNRTTGLNSAVPGGVLNEAANSAFAAGTRAKATNDGAFVWADSTDADFGSTATNQFLIRAGGGVGINTNNPGTNALSVNGSVQIMTVQILTGPGVPTISANNGSLYLRTDGGTNASLYMRIGGVWVAFAP